MDQKSFSKKSHDKIWYIIAVGGLAIITITIFLVAAFNKAKLQASEVQYLAAKNTMDSLLSTDPNCLDWGGSMYHDKALWYNDLQTFFSAEMNKNSVVYTATAVPAYCLSILTLVAFGVCLMIADKRKEKEDQI